MRRITAVGLLIFGILAALSACSNRNPSDQSASPAQSQQDTAAFTPIGSPKDDSVVAVVDGREIYYGDMAKKMAQMEMLYSNLAGQLSPEDIKEKLNEAAQVAVQELIRQQLLQNKIEAYEITPDKAAQAAALSVWESLEEATRQELLALQPELSGQKLEDSVSTALGMKGLEQEAVMAQSIQARLLELLRQTVTAQIANPQASEVNDYYLQLLAQQQRQFKQDSTALEQKLLGKDIVLYLPRSYRVLQELTLSFDEDVIAMFRQLKEYDTPDNTTYEEMLENEYRLLREHDILDIERRLEQGEPFSQLAKEYCPDSVQRLNYISQESTRFSKSYLAAALSIPREGALAPEPLVHGNGYTLLYWTDTLPAGTVPLDEAYDALEQALLEKKREAMWQECQAQWLEEAEIEQFPQTYSY